MLELKIAEEPEENAAYRHQRLCCLTTDSEEVIGNQDSLRECAGYDRIRILCQDLNGLYLNNYQRHA